MVDSRVIRTVVAGGLIASLVATHQIDSQTVLGIASGLLFSTSLAKEHAVKIIRKKKR